MPQPPNPQPGPPRLRALDGIRGAAALSVLVFHVWLFSQPRPSVDRRDSLFDHAFHELRLGLFLFFVLSGFLLYRPFAAAALAARPAPRLGAYLRRRAARILPAYYVALAGSVALLWPHPETPGVELTDPARLWLFVLFAQNYTSETLFTVNPPMWTLAVEVLFYATLPLLAWLGLARGAGSRARAVALPLALVALGLGWNLWVDRSDLAMTWRLALPAMLPYFAVGMAAAAVTLERRLGARAGLALAAGGLALVALDALLQASGSIPPDLRFVRDLIAAAGFAAVIAAAVAARTGAWLLERRAAVALGAISYGVYLWHVPLILWLRAQGLLPFGVARALPVALAVTLAVATASWLLVERPVLRRVRGGRPDAPGADVAIGRAAEPSLGRG